MVFIAPWVALSLGRAASNGSPQGQVWIVRSLLFRLGLVLQGVEWFGVYGGK